MIDKEEAKDFIEIALNRLEKSVVEKDSALIRTSGQEFKNLISDYGRIIGKENIKNYSANYKNIMKKGEPLK